jgi:hypothetical protein
MSSTAIGIAKERQLEWLLHEVLGGGAARAHAVRATFPWLAAAIALLAAAAAVGVALLREQQPLRQTQQPGIPWHECHGPAALDAVPAGVVALKCFDFDDEACARLAAFVQLEHLDLSGMDVNDKGYATSLKITDAGVRALAPLKGLRSLSLATCHQVKGDALQVFEAMPRLESLDLDYSGVETAAVERLERLPALRTLVLSHCMNWHGSALAAVARIPGLRRLELRGCVTLSAADALHLAKLTELRHLDLRDCQGRFRGQTMQIPGASDPDVDDFGKPPKTPVQDGIGITDAVVAALAATKLETLLLGGSESLTDAIGEPLAKATSLRVLDLSNLPKATGALLAKLPAQLEELRLDDNAQLAPADLQRLPALPALRSLGLSGLALDDASLRMLLGSRPLRGFALGGPPARGKGGGRQTAAPPFPATAAAELLAAMPTLEVLELRAAPYVDRRLLAAVATLPRLRVLDLTGPLSKPLLDRSDALAALAASRSVTKLSLTWNRLSTEALQALAKLPLRELDLYGTNLERGAIEAAAAAWPGCVVKLPDGQRWRAP